ncbi:DUF3800 domain-containing protein [Pseudomonas sp. MWU12-2115]|uniref:DUF3800 domain-containing protein n=1 Tax=Pseudomonas sp. MWU12-2115 TaxID=2071713 RepID=UPI000CD5A051|nr:DUF3800 domain-containing protein [Pseudomonas sp. MWU12-2115]
MSKTLPTIQKKESTLTKIYFDESGNTGRQLGDLNQPVFILGSCDFTEAECNELLAPLRSRQSAEVHFKRLRRTASGQDKIIALLSSELISDTRYKSCLFHKRFMLLCKLLDDLVENLLHENDVDFYAGGLNRSLSNLLFFALPTYCGEEAFEKLLTNYYDMVISKKGEDIRKFYRHVVEMRKTCEKQEEKLGFFFDLIMLTERNINNTLKRIKHNTFNPAIPAFFNLCVAWGESHETFEAICDDSAPVEQQESFFNAISELNNSKATLGYGPNKFELPLRLSSLSFTSSHESDGVQVTDIITGAIAYYINKLTSGDTNDELYIKLMKLNKLDKLIGRVNWPSMEITPEELGHAENESGNSPIDAMANYMIQNRINTK